MDKELIKQINSISDDIHYLNYLKINACKLLNFNFSDFNNFFEKYVNLNEKKKYSEILFHETFVYSLLANAKKNFSKEDFKKLELSDSEKIENFKLAFNLRNTNDYIDFLKKELSNEIE